MSLCLQVSGIMSNTWKITSLHYASALHYVNHKLVKLDVHTTFLFPELQLYACIAHHMTTCLITCEWQSFLGVERLLLVSESYVIWYSSRTCLRVLCKFLQLF